MAGKPFKVGRYAHTLRMRLMREHVGVDVDSIDEDQLMSREPIAAADEIETWDPDHEQEDDGISRGITQVKRRPARDRLLRTLETTVSSSECGPLRQKLISSHQGNERKCYFKRENGRGQGDPSCINNGKGSLARSTCWRQRCGEGRLRPGRDEGGGLRVVHGPDARGEDHFREEPARHPREW